MNYKVPGLGSIVLFFIAIGIAIYQLFTVSLILGAVFAVCFPLSILNMLYHYCRKCPHVTLGTCRHVIFGRIVLWLFKPLKPSEYSYEEIFLTAIPAVLTILLSQYWIIRNIYLFIAFWVIMLLAVVIIRTSVCTVCENSYCKMCRNVKTCPK